MFPTHVALVPYDEGSPKIEELLHVSSALQTQVSRDLAPLWGISAVVSPFLRLEDVPPGYVALAIAEELPRPWHGFHVVEDGTPLALIGYGKGWSLLASHELVELLCDPWGNRRLPGLSLKQGQGQVEYLVEVCDPCQHETYTIGDVVVSDFVTPEYYGPRGSRGGRYSFTGSLKCALDLPKGGYISWRTSSGQIWQQAGGEEAGRLKHRTFSRAFMDSHPDRKVPDVADKLDKDWRKRGPHYGLKKSERDYGRDLKTIIDQLLRQRGVKAPRASLDAIVKLLKELANEDSNERAAFEKDPVKTLKKFNLDPPPKLDEITLASAEHYRGILAALKGGMGTGDPKLAEWLTTLAVHYPAGIE
jgi:hypothetical protein